MTTGDDPATGRPPTGRPPTGRPSTGGLSASALARLLGLPEPTAQQAAAIEAPLGPGVLVAGAGSGKTETMASRVVWLIANGLVDPGCVLGLTFTRKAAGELAQRIRRRLAQWRAYVERDRPGRDDEQHAAMLAALAGGEPTVLTYAAYAGRLVAEHGLRLGLEPQPRMLSEALRWQLADQVVRRYTGTLPADLRSVDSVVGWVLDLAGTLSDHLVEVGEVERFSEEFTKRIADLPGRPTEAVHKLIRHLEERRQLLPLVEAFGQSKRARQAVDFADEAVAAARLAGVAEVRAQERARYRVVLLDEYQDTGHAQIELLRGLFADGHPVTAVGDPLQSIYAWRGASSGTIARFPTQFAHRDGSPAPSYPLATSWRNDSAVLEVANLIAEPLRTSPHEVALDPRPGAGAGEVTVARLATVDDEAEWLSGELARAWAAMPAGSRTAAVLVRRRAAMPLLATALEAAGLPVEIVGLGGLLTTPEVSDVVAMLCLLADRNANTAAARILFGARWQLAAADFAALGRRASALSGRATRRVAGGDPAAPPSTAITVSTASTGAASVSVEDDPLAGVERGSLIEALDDPGWAGAYSPEGWRRISALGAELRRLRQRIGEPLPDLVAEVERTIGVDVEVAARGGDATGRVHLDRFLEETARFAADADESTLTAFLAYLDAARDEEHGLEPAPVQVAAERIQLITVHGAKGLEWDVVAVPGLVESVFPADPRSVAWTKARQLLPHPLRGDRADLPVLDDGLAGDCKQLAAAIKQFEQDVNARHQLEERRLAYVAVTRARRRLVLSGYVWDRTTKPRVASPYLLEAQQVVGADPWYEPDLGETNPLTAEVLTASWPVDPLGARRAAVEEGAELVRAALSARQESGAPSRPGQGGDASGLPTPIERWQRDVELLLAERARLAGSDVVEVDLPERLSVSQLVQLKRNPAELARALRRPVPTRPAPLARRGTRFHAWLEERWANQSLLDIDELPGAADAGADDRDLHALQEAFRSSPWWTRTPAQVEVPFDMTVAGVVVRGRMDAVFEEAGGRWTVVDWKTGARPTGAEAQAAAVQLAVYRLAWAALVGLPDDELARVGAAFHYVATNETVRPHDLLDAREIRRLITRR